MEIQNRIIFEKAGICIRDCYSKEHNIFDIYPEHFALFESFAVYDFVHRKDSLNCLVLDYNEKGGRGFEWMQV